MASPDAMPSETRRSFLRRGAGVAIGATGFGALAGKAWGRDTTRPTNPTNVRQTGSTESSISIAWNASTDNVGVAGYYKYRDGVKVADVDAQLTHTFSTPTWRCGETHQLGVQAYDARNNVSQIVTIPATTAACPTTGAFDIGAHEA